eukprot:13428660-Heterocapsa_arctica.AAC.1
MPMITSNGIVSKAGMHSWGEFNWASTEQMVKSLPSNLDATQISSPRSLLPKLRVDLGLVAASMTKMA